MRRRPALLALLVFLAIAGGTSWPASARADQPRRSVVVRRATADDVPAKGPRTALVTVEVFCPYWMPLCARALRVLDMVAARHPEDLRVVYRQVVAGYRGDESLFAQAAIEAWVQGRYAEFQARLYAQPFLNAKRDLDRIALEAGLDLAALHAALADGRHGAQLARDDARAVRMGIDRPPVLVWNGVPALIRSPSTELFESLYRAAVTDARRLLDTGVPPGKIYAALLRQAERSSRRQPARWRDALPTHAAPQRGSADAHRLAIPEAGSPLRGQPGAEVTVVVFAGFPCDGCARLNRELRRFEEAYAGRVRVVFKHFAAKWAPDERGASEAAACAHLQGRFWDYLDLLYYSPSAGNRAGERPIELAGRLGLDTSRFAADMSSGRCAALVDADLALARNLGVARAPTMFVNGRRLAGNASAAELRPAIDEELRPGVLERLADPRP